MSISIGQQILLMSIVGSFNNIYNHIHPLMYNKVLNWGVIISPILNEACTYDLTQWSPPHCNLPSIVSTSNHFLLEFFTKQGLSLLEYQLSRLDSMEELAH